MTAQLQTIFPPDFFPCTRNDLLDYAIWCDEEVSKEVFDWLFELERDETHLYKSVEDIMPKVKNYQTCQSTSSATAI
jgi:hypothetical protein